MSAATKVPLFVKKLKKLVDDPIVDAATWSDNGESFTIKEPKRLIDQIEKYFTSSKLKSFVRQLHFYGFKKTGGSRSADWVYRHKYFQSNGKQAHKLRRKRCGPEHQIKTLKQQMETLQGTLASTQQKLGNVAEALVKLLENCSSLPQQQQPPQDQEPPYLQKRQQPLQHHHNPVRKSPLQLFSTGQLQLSPMPAPAPRAQPLKRRPSAETVQTACRGGAAKLVRRNSDIDVETATHRGGVVAASRAYQEGFSQNFSGRLASLTTPSLLDLDDFEPSHDEFGPSHDDFLFFNPSASPMKPQHNLSQDFDRERSVRSAICVTA